MVKEFPYRDEAVEAQVELVQKIVSGVRSARSDYTLPNKTKTELYLRVFDDDRLAADLGSCSGVIGTLAYCSRVEVTPSPPATGCAVVTVSDRCAAHLVLTGLVDPRKEEEKLGKKREALRAQLDKLRKAVKVEGYEKKVPAEVRKANEEKMSQAETEIGRLGDAIASLKEW